jgi:hypothetical protein
MEAAQAPAADDHRGQFLRHLGADVEFRIET